MRARITRRFGMGAAVTALGLAGLVVGPQMAFASGSTAVRVVKVADRAPVGNMLTTLKGKSLYIHPSGPCTGSCLSVWPAYNIPAGDTTPGGAKCLTLAAPNAKGRQQIEYQGQRLYTFVDDSGTSLNGNGVGGFMAAKVSTTCP